VAPVVPQAAGETAETAGSTEKAASEAAKATTTATKAKAANVAPKEAAPAEAAPAEAAPAEAAPTEAAPKEVAALVWATATSSAARAPAKAAAPVIPQAVDQIETAGVPHDGTSLAGVPPTSVVVSGTGAVLANIGFAQPGIQQVVHGSH